MVSAGRAEWRKREKGELQGYATAGELAAMCGVSKRTVRRWLAEERIPAPAKRSAAGWGLWSPQQVREIVGSR